MSRFNFLFNLIGFHFNSIYLVKFIFLFYSFLYFLYVVKKKKRQILLVIIVCETIQQTWSEQQEQIWLIEEQVFSRTPIYIYNVCICAYPYSHVLISNLFSFISKQFVKFSLVIFFNVTMWGCYVNSLKALSSLQATVTNFATNFLSSGLAGFFLFEEALSFKVYYW